MHAQPVALRFRRMWFYPIHLDLEHQVFRFLPVLYWWRKA